MKTKLALTSLAALMLTACGGGSGDTPAVSEARLSVAIGDAPVDTADEVVVTIDQITLKREGEADVVLPIQDADGNPVTLDLLDFQGGETFLALDGVVIPAGTYTDLRLSILDENLDLSWVTTGEGKFELKGPSDELKLGGFEAAAGGNLAFTIDFNLRKAMTYNPGPQRYIIKPRGVELLETATLGAISGTVAADLAANCANEEGTTFGAVYLYQGHGIANPSEDFDAGAAGAPADATASFSSTTVALDGEVYGYKFGLVESGDYSLAYSCNGEADLPETFEGPELVTIPAEGTAVQEVTLADAELVVPEFALAASGAQPTQ
ncbi:DUF4382 domain-containing protein [Gallaecimonas sp. GXIMD4217]|uniref:DUF4382 domain-containing protein n=1 Tax=Gallaecimonas sp. GXIMD4217 TaxID=3131927 RepID=UPI00311AF5E1